MFNLIVEEIVEDSKYVILHDNQDGKPAQKAVFEGKDSWESVQKYITAMEKTHESVPVRVVKGGRVYAYKQHPDDL